MLDYAIEDITLAIDNSKGDDVAYNHATRSWIYRASGRYEDAIKDIDVYIDRFPTRANGYSSRGLCKEHLGDYEGALKDYNEGLELDENYSVVKYYLSQIKRLKDLLKFKYIDSKKI